MRVYKESYNLNDDMSKIARLLLLNRRATLRIDMFLRNSEVVVLMYNYLPNVEEAAGRDYSLHLTCLKYLVLL